MCHRISITCGSGGDPACNQPAQQSLKRRWQRCRPIRQMSGRLPQHATAIMLILLYPFQGTASAAPLPEKYPRQRAMFSRTANAAAIAWLACPRLRRRGHLKPDQSLLSLHVWRWAYCAFLRTSDRASFQATPSRIGTTAAPTPTSTIALRWSRTNGILPKK